MNRIPLLAAVTVLVTAGNFAPAQSDRVLQGPLLLPPGSSNGSSYRGDDTPYYLRGSDYDRSRRGYDSRYDHLQGDYHAPVRYRDPRMQQVAEWYRDLLGRAMSAKEEHNWQLHLREGRPGRDAERLNGVLAMILGGDEFYDRSGREFHNWVTTVERTTGHRMSEGETEEWHQTYRRAGNRVAVRVDLVQHLLHEHAPEPIVVPDDRFRYDRPGRTARYRSDVPWYAQDADRFDHEGHGHERTTAYGPTGRPTSEADLIAGWYQTYFGREIAPHELNKWLSDREKGMSLEKVHASVLGAPEWYARSGGSPTRWVAATLAALGQGNSPDAVGYWLDRYRRHDGDRYETALEMIRSAGGYDRRADRNRDDDD